MVEKVYNECGRRARRVGSARGQVVPIATHEAHSVQISGSIKEDIEMLPHTTAVINVAPTAPRMGPQQPTNDTAGMWVEIWYGSSTKAYSMKPLSKCFTLEHLFMTVYVDLGLPDTYRISAEFKSRAMSVTPCLFKDLSADNVELWAWMVQLAYNQRGMVDTTIIVAVDDQEPGNDVVMEDVFN